MIELDQEGHPIRMITSERIVEDTDVSGSSNSLLNQLRAEVLLEGSDDPIEWWLRTALGARKSARLRRLEARALRYVYGMQRPLEEIRTSMAASTALGGTPRLQYLNALQSIAMLAQAEREESRKEKV